MPTQPNPSSRPGLDSAPPGSVQQDAAEEIVILVDESDAPIGTMEKLAAHEEGGALHRAFSVFIFDACGRTLLQRRAATKYHFAGLWTNACCGHPRPGEGVTDAGRRRLREEMAIDVELRSAGSFMYHARDDGSGLVEREIDHVLVGSFDGQPTPDPREADDWCWIEPARLHGDLRDRPDSYTPWLPFAWRVLRDGKA